MTVMSIQPVRRIISWVALIGLVALTVLLSACGGDATTTTTSTSSSGSTSSSAGTTVTIAEQTGGNDVYSFSPATITVKAGDTVKWVNNSDENHMLHSTPDGVFTASSKVARSGSNDNTYSVTFPKAGTYTITSQLVDRLKDGKHTPDPADSKATLTVTVN
jgi:plastocyanin